jgi:uncharacterized membrane protein
VTALRPPRLVLFDIDGTLVLARGAGRRAMGQALVETFGTAGPIADYDFRGKTDPRIVLDLMGAAGIEAQRIRAAMADCFDAYAHALEAALAGGGVEVLPGVSELVGDLAARDNVVLGLLTGNIEAGARVKLADGTVAALPAGRLRLRRRRPELPAADRDGARAAALGTGIHAGPGRRHRRHAARRGVRACLRRGGGRRRDRFPPARRPAGVPPGPPVQGPVRHRRRRGSPAIAISGLTAVSLLIVWLHVLSVSIWIGGLFYQSYVLLPAARRSGDVRAFLEPARRGRVIAWVAACVVVLTGLYNVTQLGGVERMMQGGGTALAGKFLLVLVMISLNAHRDFAHLPRLAASGDARGLRAIAMLDHAVLLLAVVVIYLGLLVSRTGH